MSVTRKISFIGGGKIAEILIANMTAKGVVDASRITVSNPGKARLEELRKRFGVNRADSNGDAVEKGDAVFVCVRSEMAPVVAEELGGMDFSGKTVVTIPARSATGPSRFPSTTRSTERPGKTSWRSSPPWENVSSCPRKKSTSSRR